MDIAQHADVRPSSSSSTAERPSKLGFERPTLGSAAELRSHRGFYRLPIVYLLVFMQLRYFMRFALIDWSAQLVATESPRGQRGICYC